MPSTPGPSSDAAERASGSTASKATAVGQPGGQRRPGAGWPLLVKLLVAVGLLAWLLRQVDLPALGALVAAGEPRFLAATLAAVLVALLVHAWRLHLLVRPWIDDFRTTLVVVLRSFLLSNVLPGNVAGDVYKLIVLRRASRRWTAAAAPLLIDRLAGLLVTALFFVPALLAGRRSPLALRLVPSDGLGGRSLAVAAFCALLAVATYLALLTRRGRRLRERLGHLRASLPYYSLRTLGAVLGISLLALGLGVARYQLMFRFFTLEVGYVDALLVIVLTTFAGLLPISVGGLGVQEVTISLTLSLLGVPLTAATGVALLARASQWAAAAIAGVTFLVPGPRAPTGR